MAGCHGCQPPRGPPGWCSGRAWWVRPWGAQCTCSPPPVSGPTRTPSALLMAGAWGSNPRSERVGAALKEADRGRCNGGRQLKIVHEGVALPRGQLLRHGWCWGWSNALAILMLLEGSGL